MAIKLLIKLDVFTERTECVDSFCNIWVEQ